jgi:hypothetical protein
VTHTIDSVRQTLARLTDETRCSPACKGWFVAESGSRGTEIQRCDDCCHAITGELESVLTDDDIALLPEAWVALAEEILSFEGSVEGGSRRRGLGDATVNEILGELSASGYVLGHASTGPSPRHADSSPTVGVAKRDGTEKFFRLPYTTPWGDELFAWGKAPLDPLLTLVALVRECNAGDDRDERSEPASSGSR